MNELDKFLEMQLRHMLDLVVATPAPARRFRKSPARQPILSVEIPAQPSEALPMVEQVVMAVPAAAPQL